MLVGKAIAGLGLEPSWVAPELTLLPWMLKGFLKGFLTPNSRIELNVIDIFFCFTKE